jgi:hypothetical protein
MEILEAKEDVTQDEAAGQLCNRATKHLTFYEYIKYNKFYQNINSTGQILYVINGTVTESTRVVPDLTFLSDQEFSPEFLIRIPPWQGVFVT